MAAPVKCTLQQVLDAIEKGHTRLGAARILGISPVTMWRYCKRWKAVDDALHRKRRELVDIAEEGLREALLRREAWAIAFTLRSLGKSEGYAERVEHTGVQDTEVRVRIEYVDHRPGAND